MSQQPKRSRYVKEIGRYFRDLPWAKRQALLDDVSAHVDDGELPRDDLAPWVERLGEPADYARQVREDLGLGTEPKTLRYAQIRRVRNARLRTKLVLATVLLTAAAATYGLIWFHHLQPLRFGGEVAKYGGRSIEAGGESEHLWRWRRGGRFAIGSWLENTSDRTVRVTKLEIDPDLSVPWDNWRVTLGAKRDYMIVAKEIPVRPFTLKPGNEQLIWFRGDFDTCPTDYGAGTDLTVSAVDVTYEVLGITRHKTLDLGRSYGVEIDRPCR